MDADLEKALALLNGDLRRLTGHRELRPFIERPGRCSLSIGERSRALAAELIVHRRVEGERDHRSRQMLTQCFPGHPIGEAGNEPRAFHDLVTDMIEQAGRHFRREEARTDRVDIDAIAAPF
jgi:hypothetical protein